MTHRRLSITRTLALVASLAIAAPLSAQAPTPCRSTATGNLKFHQLTSSVFGNTRTIRVLLPDDYDAPANAQRRYPVLYLLDGQNIFDACLSDVSKREWQVDETVRRLIAAGRIPPMIIVGLDHAGRDRGHEYLPYRDPYGGELEEREPAGKRFPRFLGTEVLPFVDSLYRTYRGPQNTGLGGASYGGIITLHTLAAAPGIAGYALIESAPLWVGAGQIVRDTDPLSSVFGKVYIAAGQKEVQGFDELARTWDRLHYRLEKNFRDAGYDSTRVRLFMDPEGRHTEDSWAARFPAALEFLFGDWKAPPPEPAARPR